MDHEFEGLKPLEQDGMTVLPTKAFNYAAAGRALLADAPRRARLGAAARALAATLTWDHRAARLVEFYTRRLAALR